jgi:hypothetical protein
MTTPCDDCPFLAKFKAGFSLQRLKDFSSGQFPCHQTADAESGQFEATEKSVHCAGALIFLEKRDQPSQMMRIAERLGIYDRTKLDMAAKVR